MGERRPSPDAQVLDAMRQAKRDAVPIDDAWRLSVNGHVCDSYTSARGNRPEPQRALAGPPNLRPSDTPPGGTSEKRCAGCRYVMGAGRGLARCTLYEVPVYAGVLWPHLTAERQEWKAAILATAPEWLAAYADQPTPLSEHFDLIAAALAGHDEASVGVQGQLAA